MNTLLFVPSSVPPSRAEYFKHLYPALKRMSTVFIYYNPVLHGEKTREQIHDYIFRFIKRHNITLFFAMTGNQHISPETLDAIRALGIKTVNFSTDNLDRPQSLKDISSHFDLCWVSEPEAVQIMKEFRATHIHLPMAADPSIFKPYPVREEYDLG